MTQIDEDGVLYPEDTDDESLDGVSRVGELENILSEIIDLYDEELLTFAKFASQEDREEVMATFEKAYALLAEGEL